MKLLLEGRVVGVYRRCTCCYKYKLISSFGGLRTKCSRCRTNHPRTDDHPNQVFARGIALTDLGRETLRQLRQPEVA